MNRDLIERIKKYNIEIYGISGKIGCGKDYVVNNFLRRYLEDEGDISKSLVLSLADTIKIVAISQRQVTYSEAYIEKTDKSRKCLQLLGTEMGRDKHGTFVWIDALLTQILLHIERNGVKCFFIPDIRFKEEVGMIHILNGTLIRVNAESRTHKRMLQESKGDEKIYNSIKNHVSETTLDHYDEFDMIYDNENGNYEDFVRKFIQI